MGLIEDPSIQTNKTYTSPFYFTIQSSIPPPLNYRLKKDPRNSKLKDGLLCYIGTI